MMEKDRGGEFFKGYPIGLFYKKRGGEKNIIQLVLFVFFPISLVFFRLSSFHEKREEGLWYSQI